MKTKTGRILGQIAFGAMGGVSSFSVIGLGIGISAFGAAVAIYGSEIFVDAVKTTTSNIVKIVQEEAEKVTA